MIDKLPIIEIKKTSAFSKIFEIGGNIEDIISNDKLLAYHYKKVQEQLNVLYDFIKENIIN
jgi:hypothetical protein